RGAGQRRHAVQPARRQGGARPGRPGAAHDRAAGGGAAAGGEEDAGLHARRARRGAQVGHGGGRLRGLPVREAGRRRQDRHGGGVRGDRHLLVRLVRARERPPVRGRRRGVGGRSWRGGGGHGGPGDLVRHVRPGREEGGVAEGEEVLTAFGSGSFDSRLLGRVTGELDFRGRSPGRAWRRLDWRLLAVVVALRVLGVLLVWSATQPRLLVAGGDPEASPKRQALAVLVGLAVMVAVGLAGHGPLRTWTPLAYLGSCLALAAVLTPLGKTVNGAQSWLDRKSTRLNSSH